jgi:biopolymer transport protein ExbB/TolQ
MPVLNSDRDVSEAPSVSFTGPWRYIIWMALFTAVVAALGIFLIEPLETAFRANPAINGLILTVLVIGVLYTYAQALGIGPAARWLVRFRSAEDRASLPRPPALIAPMISSADGRVSLSAGSVRTVLDSVGARMSEAGAFTRYFGRLLIFLGLLGTFWGLLDVVGAVGSAVSAVTDSSTGGEADVMRLMSAIEEPIQGMGTAFASSLFGLAGSLVIGFLDLQASRAQNRFYNEIEEWLSSISRLAAAGPTTGDDGEVSTAYVGALLQQTAETLDRLSHTLERNSRQMDTTLQRFAEDSRATQEEAMRALRDEIRVLIRALQSRERGGE